MIRVYSRVQNCSDISFFCAPAINIQVINLKLGTHVVVSIVHMSTRCKELVFVLLYVQGQIEEGQGQIRVRSEDWD
jgi:hypothetical protein